VDLPIKNGDFPWLCKSLPGGIFTEEVSIRTGWNCGIQVVHTDFLSSVVWAHPLVCTAPIGMGMLQAIQKETT